MRILSTFFFILPTIIAQAQLTAACDLNLGPNPVVCNNAVFTLNPHPTPGDYLWSGSGSSGLSCIDCPSPEVSGLTTGVYTIIATVTTPDCTASDTLVITVINGQAPQYLISADREICLGDSVHLGGPPAAGTFHNWFSVPMGFSSFESNPSDVPTTATTYYLSVSSSTCPIPMLDSVTITPITLDLQLTPADTVKICRGRSRTLQATVTPSGQALTWSAGLQVAPGGTSAVATPTESTLYSVSASIGGCTRTRQVYFAVDSLPADLKLRPGDTTICQGDILLLWSPDFDTTRYPGISFKWTRTPQTALLTPDSLQNLLVQPNMLTIYRRVTRFGVCGDTASVIVQVTPTAQLTASPDSVSLCPGDSVKVKLTYTSGVTNLMWTPPTGVSCTTCDSAFVRPAVSTTYAVSGKFQNCPVRDTVIVNLKPLAPLHFPDKRIICLGDTVRLNDVFDPAAKYTWTSTHPGFGTDTLPNPLFRPTQTATYFVSSNNGCAGLDSVRIEVQTATLTASKDTTICKNQSAVLTAMTSIPGSSFQWTDAQTGLPVSTARVISVMPGQTSQYIAQFTYGDGCRLADTVTMTVSGEAPMLIFPNDLQLCPGEKITLNLGPELPGSEYTWTASPADTTLIFDEANPEVSPGRNTTYILTAKLGNCTVTDTLDIVAYSATLTTSNDTIVCAESMVMLSALGSDPAGRYTWSTGESGPGISKSPANDSSFIVTYTYGDTCTLRDTVFVDVVPTYTLSISSQPDTNALDVGLPVTLFAVVSPPQDLSKFMFVWQETTVDTKTLPFTSESIELVPASNDTAGSVVRYTITAKSSEGCVKIAEKTFALIFPKVAFPNAFTPDGDGTNDKFGMILFEGKGYIERMEIFNRWGGLVFESTDPNAAWDGTSKGEPVPSDVYVYRVVWRRGDGALQPLLKGDVTVLR